MPQAWVAVAAAAATVQVEPAPARLRRPLVQPICQRLGGNHVRASCWPLAETLSLPSPRPYSRRRSEQHRACHLAVVLRRGTLGTPARYWASAAGRGESRRGRAMAASPAEVVVLGVNLTCLLSALQQRTLPDKDCLLTLLAKGLGFGIIVFSTILKLPQILLILRKRSVDGLSMMSFEIECVGYTVAVSYCLFKHVAFSAYGELFFLLIQAYVLVALIYYFSPAKQGFVLWLKLGIYCAMAQMLFSGKLSANVYETLYNGQTALFTLGCIPQMWTNYTNKSTGQLSLTTCFLTFVGCIARLFTSIQEKAPLSMAAGSLLGILSHGMLLAQIVIYSKSTLAKEEAAAASSKAARAKKAD